MNWLLKSNRWKHLLGGIGVGAICLCPFDGVVASVAVGAALEFKDKAHSGKWDWVDIGFTAVGGLIGAGIRYLIGWL